MAALTLPISMYSTDVFATLKTFVVAYDFSPSAETALQYALDLATRQHAEVILVHSHNRKAIVGAADEQKATHKISLATEARLEGIVKRSRERGIHARCIVKLGSPAETLNQVVSDLQPDLLFLGAYGSNRLDRKVLGSTTESLLRTLPCPVVIIGPKAVKEDIEPSQRLKVICPIDFPEDVHERLKIIARLAKASAADVEVVHAVDVCHEYSRPHSASDIQYDFDVLVERLLREGVAARSTLLLGTPERVISERAQAVNADYIVFGLHKVGMTSSYFRESLVAKVIKNAPCPILTYAQAIQPVYKNANDYSQSSSQNA